MFSLPDFPAKVGVFFFFQIKDGKCMIIEIKY